MKCIELTDSTDSPALIEKDVPRPRPREGEVLARVHAAGVTPTELAWYPTSRMEDGGKRTGAVPSHEFSGVVAEIGEGVTGLSAGTPDERVKRAFFIVEIVEPRRRQLAEIADMLEAGTLRPVVDTVLPWPQASDAYLGKAAKKGREGGHRGSRVAARAFANRSRPRGF
jgi:NADPH:quinone reductase-like Zn-dependent oxidoreductase